MEKYDIDWNKFAALIEASTGDEEDQVMLRKTLQYGTPEEKRRILDESFGLNFQDLVKIHAELEKIFYKGSLPWWFW